MAININLLPTELKVSTGLTQVLKIVRMVGIIALAAFLIFGLALAGFFIFSSVDLNNLNSTNTSLKSQLDSLSTTEAQFIALKDRIGKIKLAQSQPSTTQKLIDFQPFITPFTNSIITTLQVDPGKLTSTINFNSNADLSAFIKSISSSDSYSNVIITSFGFNPAGGYLVNFTITPKQK